MYHINPHHGRISERLSWIVEHFTDWTKQWRRLTLSDLSGCHSLPRSTALSPGRTEHFTVFGLDSVPREIRIRWKVHERVRLRETVSSLAPSLLAAVKHSSWWLSVVSNWCRRCCFSLRTVLCVYRYRFRDKILSCIHHATFLLL